jgi:drug/metabolite transporter (DMT)-like permease
MNVALTLIPASIY